MLVGADRPAYGNAGTKVYKYLIVYITECYRAMLSRSFKVIRVKISK